MPHGVTCVHSEIHEHLLELAPVDPGVPEIRIEFDFELDRLPERAAQHPEQIRNDLVEINGLWPDDLLPRKRQELVGEGGGALGRSCDLEHRVATEIVLVRASPPRVPSS